MQPAFLPWVTSGPRWWNPVGVVYVFAAPVKKVVLVVTVEGTEFSEVTLLRALMRFLTERSNNRLLLRATSLPNREQQQRLLPRATRLP